MTDDCGSTTEEGYRVYEKIAETSFGQIYRLNKSEVKEVSLVLFVNAAVPQRAYPPLSCYLGLEVLESSIATERGESSVPVDACSGERTR